MSGKDAIFSADRRSFLYKMLVGGTLGVSGFSGVIQNAIAMGQMSYPSGIQKVEGDVKINDKPAKVGSPVQAGDVITTGEDGFAIFVVG